MSNAEFEGASPEIEALVRYYRGRKLISISDIIDFSRHYRIWKAEEESPLKPQV